MPAPVGTALRPARAERAASHCKIGVERDAVVMLRRRRPSPAACVRRLIGDAGQSSPVGKLDGSSLSEMRSAKAHRSARDARTIGSPPDAHERTERQLLPATGGFGHDRAKVSKQSLQARSSSRLKPPQGKSTRSLGAESHVSRVLVSGRAFQDRPAQPGEAAEFRHSGQARSSKRSRKLRLDGA